MRNDARLAACRGPQHPSFGYEGTVVAEEVLRAPLSHILSYGTLRPCDSAFLRNGLYGAVGRLWASPYAGAPTFLVKA